ncbi:formimidoylglutamase [Rufibacter glacialis]|uniref:Formimidoylglutamase n=1 Tax=Rufibacter glacialis TaxID=1259555 RepID=A0A5M8Q714_9BACT|nr:formimidoylglutamase [Rufibacter glacialis]KAA6430676.1 formimidoylglutamase [Rufibacter glacialis]GGK85724.1 formimidoylglutamase [Rufibacter glacialis]
MYKPSDKTTWQGRMDPQDGELGLRWHQVVHMVDLSREVTDGEGNFAFLGFSCDEGVRRNQGRVGAAGGPAAIRQAMSGFADHLPEDVHLYGGGDVICANQRLEEAQEQLGRKVEMLLRKGYKTIVLGGGHETAYGHFLGLRHRLGPEETLGIINLDAHFDLRSYAQHSSSGTPFLQIADDLAAAGRDFHYLCLGIQEQGNTRKLFQTAQERQVDYILADDLHGGITPDVQQRLQAFMAKVDKLYLSIDLDVFAAAYAPGVSAPNALGLTPPVVVQLLKEIIGSGKVMSVDVVELNPKFDLDHQTAKLAASLVYQMVKAWH